MTEINREATVKAVMNNLGHEGVKAYLDREHPDHARVVTEVHEFLQNHFGETEPLSGLLTKSENETRNQMYEDPRSVTDQLRELYDSQTKWGKAYFNSADPLHAEAVQRAQILSEAKTGNEVIKEILPVVYNTGELNHQQVGEDKL